jgi:hypothetical protein
MNANSVTTADGVQMNFNALTSGRGLYVTSTTTSSSFSGNLAAFEWNPSSATTATTDLVRIAINGSANVGNLFALYDGTSPLFTISESQLTSNLPAQFTAAGDVTIAYDLVFSNQTASRITANGPLTIEAGESFENNNFTLQMFGTGQAVVALGTGYSRIESTSTAVDGSNASNLNVAGQFITTNDLDTITLLVRNANTGAIAMANVGTSGAQADPGVLTIEGAGSSTTAYNLITAYNSTTRSDASAVFRVRADGNVYGEAAFNSSGADYAEWFLKEEELAPGHVVGLNPLTKKVRKYRPGDRLIGIISTAPGFVGNNVQGLSDQELAANYALVAIMGQVPVRISNVNGVIKAGDPITFDPNNHGVAAKAVQAGYISGFALEDGPTTTTQGTKITMFVSPTWFIPEGTLSTPGGSGSHYGDFTVTGNLGVGGDLTVIGETILSDLSIVGGAIKTNKLESIDQALELQSATSSYNISAYGGKIVITPTGDITTQGSITSNKVNVSTPSVSAASAGKTVIPAGQASVTITTTALTDDSLIFATPDRTVAISARKTGTNTFVIELASSSAVDTRVNWWIVN